MQQPSGVGCLEETKRLPALGSSTGRRCRVPAHLSLCLSSVVVGFPALSSPRPRAAPKLIATLIGPEQDPGVGLDLIGRSRAASRPLELNVNSYLDPDGAARGAKAAATPLSGAPSAEGAKLLTKVVRFVHGSASFGRAINWPAGHGDWTIGTGTASHSREMSELMVEDVRNRI